MLFSKKEMLEDRIIRLLMDSNQTVKSLNRHLEHEGISVTIQAIYKALRSLVTEEIILKHLTDYSLNEEWRRTMSERFAPKTESIALSEGEMVRFDLNSLVHLDQYWKNVVFPLHEQYRGVPVFCYNHHELWMHLNESRRKSEIDYYKSFEKTKTPFYCIFGGNTIHDKEIGKLIENKYLKVNIGDRAFPDTDYPITISDYVITTRISSKTAQKVEQCFKNTNSLKELEQQISQIGLEKVKIKLIIERNKEKAKKIRKRIARDFHVPKELREKYELF